MDKEYAKYLLNKTREDYNLIAEDFSRTRAMVWPEISALFDNYIKFGEKILDLGCGNGRYLDYFGQKSIEYFGTDNSEKLIELAKKRYPKANFQVADALSLPFPDNFFDKIFSVAVFHHIPSEELKLDFLKEAKRVLKSGGILILTVWHFKKSKEIILFLKSFIFKIFRLTKLDAGDFMEPWADDTKRYYHYFTKKELLDLSKKANLKIKETGIIKNKKANRQNIYLILEK
jgi:SAM-dependent methyltransferase